MEMSCVTSQPSASYHQSNLPPPPLAVVPSPDPGPYSTSCQPIPVTSVSPSIKTPESRATALPTWRQLMKLSQEAEKRFIKEKIPKSDANMLVSIMAVLSIASCLPLSVKADNFTYWAYIPNPPLLTPVTWHDDPPLIYINDSS